MKNLYESKLVVWNLYSILHHEGCTRIINHRDHGEHRELKKESIINRKV